MKHEHEHHEEHHERRHRAKGGETGGVDDALKDLDDKPEARTNAKKIDAEAEERKHGGKAEAKHEKVRHHEECKCKRCMGGRAAKRRGGGVAHKEGFGPEHEGTKELVRKHGGKAERKEVGKVDGEHARHRADRKPRKSGGRTGADEHPFSSARRGVAATGRKVDMSLD
jgi:hypothetical protein